MNAPAAPIDENNTHPGRSRLAAFAHGLAMSVLLLLAFPPVSLWYVAPLIPVPLMLLASRGRATLGVALFAAIGTTPAWLVTHNWVFVVSSFGAPLLVAYLAVYPGVFVYAASRIKARRVPLWVVLALAWSATEFARANVLGGYAWYLTAHPLIDTPGTLVQAPARLGGTTLVGVLVACVAALISELIRTRRVVRLAPQMLAVLVVWAGAGLIATQRDPGAGEEIVVGVVQPNIPQSNRLEWTERQRFLDWEDLARLTFFSARDKRLTPDVIVWPEGLTPGWTFDPESLATERAAGYGWKMTPRFEGDAPELEGFPRSVPATQAAEEVFDFQSRLGIPLIVGGPAFDNLRIVEMDSGLIEYQNDAQYNSVFVVSGGRVHGRWYNKMHLTPFGETMPIISRSEWLEQRLLGIAAGGMSFTLTAGDDPAVLEVPAGGDAAPSWTAAAPVCFEGTVPQVCRELVFQGGERRAGMLVNLSNDGWFMHWDPGRRAHMQNARWRAVELATPLVRSANTGYSCVVDRWGRVVSDTLTERERDPRSGYINAPVGLGVGSTLYAIVGETAGYAVSVCVVVMLVWSILRERTEKKRPGSDPAEATT